MTTSARKPQILKAQVIDSVTEPGDKPNLRVPAYIGLYIVLICLSVLKLQGAPVQKEAALLIKAIEQANAEFAAAYGKGDAKAIAEMYTEKGRLFPPNSEVVEGRKPIEEFWKGAMDAGIKSIKLNTVEVETLGDTLIEQGTATLHGKDQAVMDRVKYLVVWKQADGKWKLHRDFWNSSVPTPAK